MAHVRELDLVIVLGVYMWKWMIVFCVAFSATLNAEIKVLTFAGSTREESVNKKLVLEAARIIRQLEASVVVVDLKDYPIPFKPGWLPIRPY